MSLPVNHKTVFVLDHSSFFNQSCNQSVEYDILGKGKTPGIIPAAPIFKSLWTCSVETMMEYIRVVYDIYQTNKLVSIIKLKWGLSMRALGKYPHLHVHEQGTKIFKYCTCPARRVTYNFRSYCKHMHLSFKSVCNKEHKGVICNMTSSSSSFQSTRPVG